MSETIDQPISKHKVRSIFWPLTLISIGVIFLLSNLGVMKVDLLGLVAIYWPLIFVIGSLDDVFQGKELPGSVISIGFGVILIAGNLGYLPMDGLQLLLRLWPVIIVAFGLNLLFANRSLINNIIGVGLALIVVVGMFFLGVGQFSVPERASQQMDVALAGASDGELNLSLPVGPVTISAGDKNEQLLGGTYTLLKNERISQNYAVEQGHGTLDLSSEWDNVAVYTGFNGAPRWDLKVNPTIPLGLKLKLAVGEIKAIFSGTEVNHIEIENAVGFIDITCANQQDLDGKISNAVGRIIIRVPADAKVTIHADTAMTLVSKPAGWTRTEGLLTSPEGTSSQDIVLDVNNAVGFLTIEVLP